MDLFLLACLIINGCIVGHIAGAMIGSLLGKLVNCLVGIEVKISNKDTGASELLKFNGREAWIVQSDFERIRRYHRDNQAAGR